MKNRKNRKNKGFFSVLMALVAVAMLLVGVNPTSANAAAAPTQTHCGITATWTYHGKFTYPNHYVKVRSRDSGAYRSFCIEATRTLIGPAILTINLLDVSYVTTSYRLERSLLLRDGYASTVWTRLGGSTAKKYWFTLRAY